MNALRRIWRGVDAVFEVIALVCLVGVLFVVLWQIFSRQILGDTPPWSEETARVLLIWIGFLGAAISFREGAHIAIHFLVDHLPTIVQRLIGFLVQALTIVFGLYLIIQGAEFANEARNATLPGTGLPRSVMYVVMPVAGFMIVLYTVLQAFGVDTHRYAGMADDEID